MSAHKTTPRKKLTEEQRLKKLAYVKEYNKTHYESISKRKKRYYKENRDKIMAYKEANREKIRAQANAYARAHRQDHKICEYRRLYGLTIKEFNAILAGQGGACAVCGSKDWGKRSPMVDHDHKTGKVRGILCCNCNTAAGMLKDDPARARKMAEYLDVRCEDYCIVKDSCPQYQEEKK